ncbi:MAG: alkaline phosphatase D family protein [Burkholderiaceae bacterium]
MAVSGASPLAEPPRRRWLRDAIGGMGLATGAVAGCATTQPPNPTRGPVPIHPSPRGEAIVAPGGVDPSGLPEWRAPGDPFVLGVASGLPRADGVTLWTRLAPSPMAEDGGVGARALRVRWAVWEEGGGEPIRSGIAAAEPDWAHTVRVTLDGLAPGRAFRYRFASGDATSTTGRFRTAPPAGGGDRLRLVFASCQQYEQGHFAAWRHAVAHDPDLIVFLGDYIYESSWGRSHVRKHDPGVPTTLAAYRRRHALYRSDPDLQSAHAVCAWVPTWDDHEVDNDYAAERSQRGASPEVFLARRQAAYRAYFEHLPLPWSMAPKGPSMRLYGHVDWGAVARIHVLDDRQYRSPQACSPPGFAGSRIVGPECVERLDPARTLLGAEQEAWFSRSVHEARARWNLVAQQTLMGRADVRAGPEQGFWTDGWDGYPRARQRLLAALRDARATNPIALGGDVHAFYAGELHEDFDRPGERAAMLEFVGVSITSQGPSQARIDTVLAENPHQRWGSGRARGFGLLELDARVARVSMRGLDDVTDRRSGCRTLHTFEVREGSGRLDG